MTPIKHGVRLCWRSSSIRFIASSSAALCPECAGSQPADPSTYNPENMENDMSAAIARLLPRASAARVAVIDTFVTLALFSGFGLLLSLTVVIADQYVPGEWF